MKTSISIVNSALQKKRKKNRKGFSLVELIVVLVIMAILAAALVPSLIGYISKTKEQNVQSECQSAVQAAQTIATGVYADTSGTYTFTDADGGTQSVTVTFPLDGSDTSFNSAVKVLSEVPGTVTVTTNSEGLVTELVYTSGSNTCTYERATSTAPGTYTNS